MVDVLILPTSRVEHALNKIVAADSHVDGNGSNSSAQRGISS
jgi:hypothetical protein